MGCRRQRRCRRGKSGSAAPSVSASRGSSTEARERTCCSRLKQITRGTVRQLQLAWSWAMDPGTQVTTPLVHDGVMCLASPNSIVQALDAANGDLLWEFRDTVE